MSEGSADDGSDGLAALYIQHRAALVRFLTARTGSAAEAEDVVQEMWLKIGSVPSGPIGNGRAYLYRVAQNLVLDRLRAGRRRAVREQDWADVEQGQRPDGPEPRAEAVAETELIAREDVARLAVAIGRLPPGAARALRLHKLDGLSHAETAARLGISRKGVEKHMAVAMAHLRRMLDAGELG
ncbi:RNA polymerase sigma factor [Sphingomonas sp. 10B4]|uniref:RNA polymerase sigma factor n=1 Tax=Sphingomonas sp. 10B4 TaxID=3048575 RepID=UPI002AB50031|nr:RNA polymerase sigma factor [Sphingomonas sp. 10B4]MDY7526012.1 RNA polymerase sigma factor [Sphingomonas sp. 10B4]MEB0283749.1 RNA polymerase sigma factor [Sphingomonas sp. 10B4]